MSKQNKTKNKNFYKLSLLLLVFISARINKKRVKSKTKD